MTNEPERDRLSWSRFRNVNLEDLTAEEYADFVFSHMMNQIIERLESAVPNDRVFKRLKYDVMAIIHSSRAELGLR